MYQKIQMIRSNLCKCDIKKNGVNSYQKYNYYRLEDFLPVLNEEMSENGVFSNMQSVGAVQTYARRYLYMTAFEIAETDVIEETAGKEESKKTQNDRYYQEQEKK